MIMYVSEKRVKRSARRMQAILSELGTDLKYVPCLNLAVRLLGFDNYTHFCKRDPDAPLSLLDHEISDGDFVARDNFQMAVLADAGLGHVARELLDRANPTGTWGSKAEENMVEG
jgi:hypothetical protein